MTAFPFLLFSPIPPYLIYTLLLTYIYYIYLIDIIYIIGGLRGKEVILL